MGDSPIQKTDALLQSGCLELERLFTQIKKLADIQKQVARYLDEKLMSYCQVANILGNKLVLVVANGSVATQIRFQTDNLLQRFKEDPLLKHIFTIECKVRPLTPPNDHLAVGKTKSPPLLSQETAAMLEASALEMKDPALRETMLKIAKHRKS